MGRLMRCGAVLGLGVLAALAGCKKAEAPETVMVEGTQAEIPALSPKLQALHLRGVGAVKVFKVRIPESVRDLNLSDNALPALPEQFVPAGVQRLWLADNRLVALPRSTAQWTRLRYLNLDRNLLAELPALDALPLRWLRLNGNRLSSLPALPETLERLYLADNRLTEAPRKPKALKHLVLAGNPLKAVPEDLGAGLTFLDLSRTGVTSLPQDLKGWQSLKVLNLSGCPLSEAERDRIEGAFDRHYTTVLF